MSALPIRLVAAVGLLIAGCVPAQESSSSAGIGVDQAPAPTTTPTTAGYCPQPGPDIARVLPVLTGQGIATILTNPYVPFGELVSVVLDVVQAKDQGNDAFRTKLTEVVDKVANVDTALRCAYKTDNLGVRIYRQDGYAWSGGVAVVIHEDIEAPIDIAKCFVLDQFTFDTPTATAADVPGPHFDPCGHGTHVIREDESYTVLWAGSSDDICNALAAAVG
ncbi:hypothetical protein ALI22I_24155 [Saccharothrix sp. ALI-22-I]|uniref:hypothetical protein n=1 Tax=Saccharothrix sp. ALI-22-I TaxID=1933778 RepID=UPI00097C0514|nr:hypothetical protein [Saccharothrix sp. ALI-22-I]ONI86717.1 hypothetical protein ALI22I_24155 [Saccharothrix sp. ALI-22-I]